MPTRGEGGGRSSVWVDREGERPSRGREPHTHDRTEIVLRNKPIMTRVSSVGHGPEMAKFHIEHEAIRTSIVPFDEEKSMQSIVMMGSGPHIYTHSCEIKGPDAERTMTKDLSLHPAREP